MGWKATITRGVTLRRQFAYFEATWAFAGNALTEQVQAVT